MKREESADGADSRMKGKIIKGIGGFYYVQTDCELIECKARGLFRKTGESLLVGDDVEIEAAGEAGKGFIVRIYPRRNELIRPPVSNVDQVLLLFALEEPKPNFNLLDRFLIMLEQKKLPVVLGFNKADLKSDGLDFLEHYQAIGYPVHVFSAHHSQPEELRGLLAGKTTVLAGPSGVGKSTLVNFWQSEVVMKTGAVSQKIGRGKHTTRHVNLIALDENSFVVDTPGFTSFDLRDISYRQLHQYFPEFAAYETDCQFLDCQHDRESGCAVKAAAEAGDIWMGRYRNYLQIKEELKQKDSGLGKLQEKHGRKEQKWIKNGK